MSAHITHLSFSRLTELAHSPLALKNYIAKVFEPTKAMDEGSLLDCLLFTPEELEKKFLVIEKISKSTTIGKEYFARMEAQSNGRTMVHQEQFDEAKFLCDMISSNATVTYHGLLNPDFFKFQVPCEFFKGGFKHRGIKDADGHDRNGNKVIWDLKRMGSRSGEQLVRSQIRNNMYDLQAAVYCYEFDSNDIPVKYHVVAVDNEGYTTPFEITLDSRRKAGILWNKLIKAAHHCNMVGLDQGCEFWAEKDGFFKF